MPRQPHIRVSPPQRHPERHLVRIQRGRLAQGIDRFKEALLADQGPGERIEPGCRRGSKRGFLFQQAFGLHERLVADQEHRALVSRTGQPRKATYGGIQRFCGFIPLLGFHRQPGMQEQRTWVSVARCSAKFGKQSESPGVITR